MNIKLIILDIDGVLTNSCKTYNLEGEVISKDFNDKDFTAIKRFKENGISVCFLSADNRVNKQIAKSRKIDFYYTRDFNVKDKIELLPVIKKDYNVDINDIIYVGDDLPDYKIIKALKYTYCPSDSILKIKNNVKTILKRSGGTGVIAELYDNIYDE
tara:strand:- start:183 stop:653 length:471 start_codon:yes stop_codon:yes gene_type:complete